MEKQKNKSDRKLKAVLIDNGDLKKLQKISILLERDFSYLVRIAIKEFLEKPENRGV